MREIISRQQFDVAIQADIIATTWIARETIKVLRKNVIAMLWQIFRKRKPFEKQKVKTHETNWFS
jgi:translation elongation factor EF-4